MQLFYAPDFTPNLYTLSEEESKHAVRVLRLGEADTIHITDGAGNLYTCIIEDANPKRCRVRVTEHKEHFERLSYELTLAVAPTKNSDRFEWFLEKATEIGISEIIPLESAHSERRVFKPERSVKVITAAMKQSLKAYHPTLRALTKFKDVLTMPFDGEKFIAHCEPESEEHPKPYLFDLVKPRERTLILIGPEGDFSPEEISLARECGFREISLGKERLRTETAAVAATMMVSVANYAKH